MPEITLNLPPAAPQPITVDLSVPPPQPITVDLSAGPQGPQGPAGPEGTGITPVVLTASDYYNLPIAEQLDPWKIYIIPVLT